MTTPLLNRYGTINNLVLYTRIGRVRFLFQVFLNLYW